MFRVTGGASCVDHPLLPQIPCASVRGGAVQQPAAFTLFQASMACSHAAAHRDTAVPRPPAPHPARPARAGRHARRLLRPPSRAAPDTAGTAPRTAPDQRRHGLVSDTRVIHRPSAARCAEVRRQQRRIVPGDHLGSNLRRSAAGNSKTAYRAPVAQLLIQHCFHRWPWLEPAVWPARHLVLMD